MGGFFMALSMTFLTPDSNSSTDDKIEMIRYNQSIANKMLGEVVRVSDSYEYESKANNKPRVVSNLNGNNISEDLEFWNIYNQICRLSVSLNNNEELADVLSEIIGNDNIRYQLLIDKVRLKLYREIIEYQRMYFDTGSEDERQSIKAIILEYKMKIDALGECLDTKEMIEASCSKNKLFFLAQDSGRVIVKEILEKEDVPKAYFSQIANLLMSIINGDFRHVKRLAPRPFYEIKFGDLRILFDKLSDDTFIIIDIFLKKTTMSTSYRDNMDSKEKQYMKYRDYFKSAVDDSELVEEQAEIMKSIMTILGCENFSFGGR